MSNTLHWIMFQRIFGYGTKRSEEILDVFGHPTKLFEKKRSELFATTSLLPKEMEFLSRTASLEKDASEIYEKAVKIGCTILTPDHEKYPSRLRHIYAKPSVLYVLGNVDVLNNEKAIAMVGPRSFSLYGERVAKELAAELVSYDITVVSGLARGIDSVAHIATLQAGGCTIAVLGNGIDTVYPTENTDLHRLIIKNGGAVVSEFVPGEKALPFHFPIRNRIVSGLSLGVVVVEGANRSGSLITAGHAIAQNRDVFAVPGEIYSVMSQATNRLIKQGAIMLTSAVDICEQYPYLIFEKTHNIKNLQIEVNIPNRMVYNEKDTTVTPVGENNSATKKQATVMNKKKPVMEQTKIIEKPGFLDAEQGKIWDTLGLEPISSDDVCQKTGLPVSKVLSTLTQLELFDLIITCPGRTFKIR